MDIILNDVETRVLGSLVEKDVTTPDYYPLSLNALVNACNQKNNRDPVMNLDEEAVREALATLQEKTSRWPNQQCRQPRHQVRASPAGSVQFHSRRNRGPLRFAVARPSNPRRTPRSHRAHASLRRPHRSAIQRAAPDAARPAAGQSSAQTTRNQRSPLQAPASRRRGRCYRCGTAVAHPRVRPRQPCRRRSHNQSGG